MTWVAVRGGGFLGENWRLEHKSMAQTVCDMGGGRCLRCTGGEMHPHEV